MAEDVEGLEELLAAFERVIGAALGEPVARAALAGAEIIHNEAERLAPGPHLVVVIKKQQREFVEMHIALDRQKWYYRFFETGVSPHVIGPKQKKALSGGRLDHPLSKAVITGGVAARPFMRPAVDNKKDEALKAVGEVFWSEIKKRL